MRVSSSWYVRVARVIRKSPANVLAPALGVGSGVNAPLSLHDSDVAIDGHVGEALDPAARLRPFDLHPAHLRGSAQAEDFAHVVRRQVAAARGFVAAANHLDRKSVV